MMMRKKINARGGSLHLVMNDPARRVVKQCSRLQGKISMSQMRVYTNNWVYLCPSRNPGLLDKIPERCSKRAKVGRFGSPLHKIY